MTPCEQSSPEIDGEGRGMVGQGTTEQGMVLFNVAAGTQLHVR